MSPVRLIRRLTSGSFGDSYLVECAFTSRYAVIKEIEISRVWSSNEGSQLHESMINELLMEEARIHSLLDKHVGLIRLFDFSIENSSLRLLLDFCPGGSLKNLIDEERIKGNFFEEATIIDWAVDLTAALHFLHSRQVLHRDVTSDNVFVLSNDCKTLKLGDFGVAKLLSRNLPISKIAHLPPETLSSTETYTDKSEIWCLGIILYELICLCRPFPGRSHQSILAEINRKNYLKFPEMAKVRYSRKLRSIIKKLLANSPLERPSADEVTSGFTNLDDNGYMAQTESEIPEIITKFDSLLGSIFEKISESTRNSTPSGPESPYADLISEIDQLLIEIDQDERPNSKSTSPFLKVDELSVQLTEACRLSDVSRVGQLLQNNILIDCKAWSVMKESPVHIASKSDDNLQIMELICQHPAANSLLEMPDFKGQSPIHRAALCNAVKIVELLLKKDPAKFINLKERAHGRTVLHHAAGKGYLDLVKMLVERFGANLETRSESQSKEMAIHLAVVFGKIDVVDFFLKKNSNLATTKTSLGHTLLHLAVVCDKHSVEMSQFLVDKWNFNVFEKSNEGDDSKLSIHLAAESNNNEVIDYLLSIEPSLKNSRDLRGYKPIHSAALRGSRRVVQQLLEDVDNDRVGGEKNEDWTVLHLASENGDADFVRMLCNEFNADVFARTRSGKVGIHVAAFYGHLKVVKFFVKKHSSLLKIRDESQLTPLDFARQGRQCGCSQAERVETWIQRKLKL